MFARCLTLATLAAASANPGRAGRADVLTVAPAAEVDDPEAVSDELFAGAVTAAVLLAFVLGFSAGALSRTQILRCLRAVTKRLPSPRQRRPDITMTTLSGQPSSLSSPSPSSSLSSSPPAKPQRSFRDKRGEDQEEENNAASAAYLEACDHVDEGKGNEEERREEGEMQEENDGKREEDEREGDDEDGERNNKDERKRKDEKKNRRDDEDEDVSGQSSQSDDEDPKQEVESSSSCRPSRVIRVYQYDRDGRRYGHLPTPEPGRAPALKQRAASLTHLSAIMAAASAGPMDAVARTTLFDATF
ncbi:uncharacterized protein LOC133481763 [Phyllopteryx taeniolatus]|uniref:uncharacterized protein LOC133481763 n=1 Tax=Phyllopteryx taeniolatus TaxID=161469 RepID=UPI002AD48DCD|nr:uncharacterized protein LOC133481763 [Phyllopteryx taeniolatus]XP_061636837.1 uncharacterized protein LOC133481763 [Phyllopteryx taeniolatus]